MSTSTALPPLYDSWVLSFLPGPLPDETRATCSDCAMCTDGNAITFDARTKCCTYVPSIPNFLAGRILEQRVVVFEEYLSHAQVTPHGVTPHKEFTSQYHPSSPLFGRNLNWRCPYYLHDLGGLCGIWQHRNARCATWFCKHLRGEISREFWSAIETLLTSVEKSLTSWCIQELEAGSPQFREIFPVPIGNVPFAIWMKQQSFYSAPADREWMWGKWAQREQEFFVACAAKTASLSWNEISFIAGPEMTPLRERVLETYARLLDMTLPETIRIAGFEQSELDADHVRIWNGNPYDTITLTKQTLRLLHRMSGQKLQQAIPFVGRDLLQELVNAKILI